MVPGAQLRVGAVHLLITAYATPCEEIAGSFADGKFARISQRLHPGWSRVYARVIEGGVVRVGDGVRMRGA